jgi:hypothetical protein
MASEVIWQYVGKLKKKGKPMPTITLKLAEDVNEGVSRERQGVCHFQQRLTPDGHGLFRQRSSAECLIKGAVGILLEYPNQHGGVATSF